MPPSPSKTRMGELHVAHVAEVLGMKVTKASGSQWSEQSDARHGHDEPFALRGDGKSTLGQGITIDLALIEKTRDQAHGERPVIPLRWYGNEALTDVREDWVAIPLDDLAEMRDAAVAWAELTIMLGGRITADRISEMAGSLNELTAKVRSIGQELGAAQLALENAERTLDERMAEIEDLRRQLSERDSQVVQQDSGPKFLPEYIPHLPWFVVNSVQIGDARYFTAIRYEKDGSLTPVRVGTVRVERSHGEGNRPRLIVDDVRVPAGDWFHEGRLQARACADDPSIEVG